MLTLALLVILVVLIVLVVQVVLRVLMVIIVPVSQELLVAKSAPFAQFGAHICVANLRRSICPLYKIIPAVGMCLMTGQQ